MVRADDVTGSTLTDLLESISSTSFFFSLCFNVPFFLNPENKACCTEQASGGETEREREKEREREREREREMIILFNHLLEKGQGVCSAE